MCSDCLLFFGYIYSNIIWLGDLNYRLAAGYDDTHELLKKNNWQALLEKDQVIMFAMIIVVCSLFFFGVSVSLLTQCCIVSALQLRIEQKAGRVFKGWNEGNIYFAPTYKYLTNSDHYVAQSSKSKIKRRTPAW